MRILILSPSIFPSITGNAVTAERWRKSLTGKGATVEVAASPELDVSSFKNRLRDFSPDLIHVHHAYKGGTLLLELDAAGMAPLVVSPGGTDLNLDVRSEEKRKKVRRILKLAVRIIVQNSAMTRDLCRLMPEIEQRIVYVPKAAGWFGEEPCDLRRMAGCAPCDVLFFLPAGIRPVKGNLEALQLMDRIHQLRPQTRFAAAGPPIDREYAARFEKEIRKREHYARWVGTIPPSAMLSAYKAADIVLNTSFSEGLSNCLLEAIAAGKSVLASDIPGNRQPVLGEEGEPEVGILFDPHNSEDFEAKALELVDDEGLRNRYAQAARLRSGTAPEKEAEGLLAAYAAAILQARSE